MALVNVPGGYWFPDPPYFSGNNPAYINNLIDATAEKFAYIFRAPKAGTLDKFEFKLNGGTQLPANGFKVSFQGVDTGSGEPDGVIGQFRVFVPVGNFSWQVPGLITSDGTDTGTKRTVAAGDLIACVIEFASFIASDLVQIATIGYAGLTAGFPYANHFTAAWAKQTDGFCMAIKYDDGSYGYIPSNVPASLINSPTYNSGSSPNEKAVKFTLPFKARLSNVIVRATWGQTADLNIYDGDGTTVLGTLNHIGTMKAASNASNMLFTPSTSLVLNAGVGYRIAVKALSASPNLLISDFDFNSAAIAQSMAGGANVLYSSRTGAGAWTDVDTKRICMSMIFDQVDDGAVVGGPSVSFI